MVRDNPFTTDAPEVSPIAENLTIWPNPSTGPAHIRGTLLQGGSCILEITDMVGRTLSTTNLGYLPPGDFEHPMETTWLSPGLYSCRLIQENGSATTRLFIQ